MLLPEINGLSGGVVGDSTRRKGDCSSKILVELSDDEVLELDPGLIKSLGVL